MNIGRLKVLYDRSRNYITGINTLMIGYLFLKEAGLHWWYLLIVAGFILWMIFDNNYILGKERDFIWTRSGRVNDMLNQIKDIHEWILTKKDI